MAAVWLMIVPRANLDPKIRRAGRWAWQVFESMLRMAKEHGWGGIVPDSMATAEEIGFWSNMPEEFWPELEQARDRLVSVGLIQRIKRGYKIVNWSKYQRDPEKHAAAQAAYRDRLKDQTEGDERDASDTSDRGDASDDKWPDRTGQDRTGQDRTGHYNVSPPTPSRGTKDDDDRAAQAVRPAGMALDGSSPVGSPLPGGGAPSPALDLAREGEARSPQPRSSSTGSAQGPLAAGGGCGAPPVLGQQMDLEPQPAVAPPSKPKRKPAPEMEACTPAVDLWRSLCVGAGLPDVSPGGWKDATRSLVAKAAADLPATEALFRRVIASPWLRDTQKPDLLWVLRDGRERIEMGRFDRPSGGGQPQPRATPPPWATLAGINCEHRGQAWCHRVRRGVMVYGNNRAEAEKYVQQQLAAEREVVDAI